MEPVADFTIDSINIVLADGCVLVICAFSCVLSLFFSRSFCLYGL